MDLNKIIFELRQRLKYVDDAIRSLEVLAARRQLHSPETPAPDLGDKEMRGRG